MIYIGIVILTPIAIALLTKDFYSIVPFITAGIISTVIGVCLRKFFPNASSVENLNDIKKTEALFVVAVSWIIFGIISGIPYLFYGINPVDAMFEALQTSVYLFIIWFPLVLFITFKILFFKKDMDWGKTAHGLVMEEQANIDEEKLIKA